MNVFKKNSPAGMRGIAAYYTLIYCASSIYIYLPKYLQQGAGLTVEQNGAIQAVGPFVAMIMPLVWGQIADKSKSRNTIWAVVLFGTAVSVLMLPLSKNFFYIACALACVSMFQASLSPMADSVCSEICSKKKWDFGQIRKIAPLGYAVTTFAAGAVLRLDRPDMFIAYGFLTIASIIPVLRLPKVPGYQFKKIKIPLYKLFSNKPLVILFCFTFCIFLTSSYYYSFILLYFTSPAVGGGTAAFGVCNALASFSEFPMLLFIDRAIRRFGVTKVFLSGLVCLAVRWFLLGAVPYPAAMIVINMLHGCSFACVSYCAIIYINEYVQDEFKASGQAFNGIVCFGVTKVIGSAAGGYLTGRFGYQIMFMAMGIFMAAVAFVYALMIPRIKKYGTERE